MPNTPVGSLDAKISRLIKLKVNLASQENRVTLGGYCGGHPPQKNGPIFSQKFAKHAKYDSTLASSKFRRGAGGQAEKTREPEIAYASVRIWPFSLTSGPAGYS
jgi:hypothetical protein